ncbi:two pore domain potassium channel family protein [Candidatus Kaiserbacteria bacterium]|nr:two pore domain potassium channel family protein [Candidatus Kaiserbacteria bacterium]
MKSLPRMTAREKRVEDWFELPMMMVTLLLVFTLVIPIVFPLPPFWNGVFATINFFIWFAFYIELFTKLYVAKSKLAALKRNWWLAVIAIAPLFIPFRFMRLSRLVGFVRFLRLQKAVDHLRRGVRDLIYNVEYILITFIIFILCSAFMMWQIELHFDGSIVSLVDALWWAAITVTTVGYGGVVPASSEGKLFGAVVSLLGTIIFMVFVVRVTVLFVNEPEATTPSQGLKN